MIAVILALKTFSYTSLVNKKFNKVNVLAFTFYHKYVASILVSYHCIHGLFFIKLRPFIALALFFPLQRFIYLRSVEIL